jgi:serine O-acetyltransferase
VVIGSGAKVLGPIAIGADSRVGANAVVVRPVPGHSVVVGVPGQIISSGGLSTGTTPTSDPVGASVQSLLTRVDRLELELSGHVEDQPSHLRADGTWELHDYVI